MTAPTSELRLKAKELEKIKFVLDYKYKELKKEMEPKETQILHMKEQIKEMDEVSLCIWYCYFCDYVLAVHGGWTR